MQLLKKITSVITLILMLIVLTGFNIERHNCASCNITDYHFFPQVDKSCCTNDNSCTIEIPSTNTNCCSADKENSYEDMNAISDQCCTHESIYVSFEQNFTPSSQVVHKIDAQVILIMDFNIRSDNDFYQSQNSEFSNHTENQFPPGIFRAADFRILTHQLQIDCPKSLWV